MGYKSDIEWCFGTGNLWIGCVEKHEGCDNCYAKLLDHRWGHNNWGNDVPRRAVKKVWKMFEQWQKDAAHAGAKYRIFVGSMMDIFEKSMPLAEPITIQSKFFGINETCSTTGELRSLFFNQVVPLCPNLIFLLLTKRERNIVKYIPPLWEVHPPDNVMFGVSIVNQPTYDNIMPEFIKVKGEKFISMEPMLGPIDLTPPQHRGTNGNSHEWIQELSWIIVGGESGPKRRPFEADWAREIRKRCNNRTDMGRPWPLAFFMKQIDKVIPVPADLLIREFPFWHDLQKVN